MSADEIIQKYISVSGGDEELKKINSVMFLKNWGDTILVLLLKPLQYVSFFFLV